MVAVDERDAPDRARPSPTQPRQLEQPRRASHGVGGTASSSTATDPAHLSEVVRFDLPRLGDIAGLDVVHLQCHIGTDTLSLARLGARVTGLDFSPGARRGPPPRRATRVRLSTTSSPTCTAPPTCSAPASFDLVYTGIGALCWLPSVRRWAEVVAALLRPGGRLFIREGHPMLWSLADPRRRPRGRRVPVLRDGGHGVRRGRRPTSSTRARSSAETSTSTTASARSSRRCWTPGCDLLAFEEHDSVPWTPLEDQMEQLPTASSG